MTWIVETAAPSRLGTSFRWLLASSWITNLSDGMRIAAGPLLVASQSRDPVLVAHIAHADDGRVDADEGLASA